MQYPSERWKDGPYRKVKSEQTSSMIDKRSGKFLTGLLPRVLQYCRSNNIHVDYQPPLDTLNPQPPSLPGIVLRDDQIPLLQKVDQHRRGLLVAPPGIGKTALSGAIISQYPDSVAIMVVHTNSLFTQTVENFQKWFGEKDVGVVGDSIYKPSRINVIMVKTAHNLCAVENGKFLNPNGDEFTDLLMKVGVMIIDESHHAGEINGMYAVICKCCQNAQVKIGMTATPNKNKRKALVCEGLLGPIIGELTMQEGIDQGLLAKPKVKLIPVPYKESINNNWTYGPTYKMDEKTKEKKLVANGFYQDGIILNRARNRLVAKEAAARVEAGQTVLIMITDVVNEQGKMLQEMARDLYGLDIAVAQGPTDSAVRETIKKALQARTQKCVICTTIWREGINIPSLDCVIWASGGKSDIATLQGLGRGLRTTDEKKEFVIVDFLDPYKYLAQHTIQRLRIYVENGCL